MTSRFEVVDEEYIEELKDKSEKENTKKSMEFYWLLNCPIWPVLLQMFVIRQFEPEIAD